MNVTSPEGSGSPREKTGFLDAVPESLSDSPMRNMILALLAALLASCSSSAPQESGEEGFRPIFDGKTLEGWSAPDMSFFSVTDGAITGEATPKHLPKENQFIVWQGGKVKNFDLRFRFRVYGAKANSGMQFRSAVHERGLVHGYQADIALHGPYLGGIWDEYGPRRSLAARGESVEIDEDGKRKIIKFGDADDLAHGIDLSQWTDYRILAEGNHILLEINGKKMSELVDRERGKAAAEGVLAMPIIPEPMRVQYKDIRLKTLP